MLKYIASIVIFIAALAENADAQGIRKDLPPRLQPKNIVTSFHRRTVDSSEAPWRSIGRVNIGGRAHCSGTLVAPNIVLTAAHCLYSPAQNRMVVPNIVHFLSGYSKGEFQGHSKVKSFIYGEQFDGTAGAVASNLRHDWALLTLEEPLGAKLGYVEIPREWTAASDETNSSPRTIDRSKKLQVDPKVTTAGYPGDRSHVISLEEDCNINGTAAEGHIIFTTCIALKGDSGGPILQQDNTGTWSVIGIQTAATLVANKHSSIGVSALTYQHKLVDLITNAPAN